MARRAQLQLALCAAAVGACLFMSNPPSDAALRGWFHDHPELQELAALYHADHYPMSVHANGEVFSDETQRPRPSAERLATYRQLLRSAGASVSFGGGPEGTVELYFPARLHLPTTPMKSLLYSTTPPTTVTSGRTDAYVFQPGQHHKVCRPIEANWYVCKDYTD